MNNKDINNNKIIVKDLSSFLIEKNSLFHETDPDQSLNGSTTLNVKGSKYVHHL